MRWLSYLHKVFCFDNKLILLPFHIIMCYELLSSFCTTIVVINYYFISHFHFFVCFKIWQLSLNSRYKDFDWIQDSKHATYPNMVNYLVTWNNTFKKCEDSEIITTTKNNNKTNNGPLYFSDDRFSR